MMREQTGDRFPSPPASSHPLALYIHWPFCLSKCPYCDFNSHVRAQVDDDLWQRALLAELDYWGSRTKGRRLTSVFFGGGTPSLMPPQTVQALLERAHHWWTVDNEYPLEITLEANPTSVEASRLREFRQAGINRLSLGVQALNDADLRLLGRHHTAHDARQALEAVATLFPRFSFDLIYARPGQSPDAWARELEDALTFAPGHLSLYQLTIEPGTRFAALAARGDLVVPDEEAGATLYDLTQERLDAAGLPAYEISNHARAGQACRHNLAYWRYEDYVGIGPGAHGRITLDSVGKCATIAPRLPEMWLNQSGEGVRTDHTCTPVPPEEQVQEMLLMGLRLTEGIPLARLREAGYTPPPAKVATLIRHGLLTPDPDTLCATRDGRLRLNALIAELA